LPLNIRMALPYLSMGPYTDAEWDTLPHIVLTSERDWNHSILDRELDDDENWFDALNEEVEYPGITQLNEPDYESLCPKFGWLSTNILQETFNNMTQYVRLPGSKILKKRFKYPFSALNMFCCAEPVAMDTVYSDVTAIADGSVCAQLYIGVKSTVADVCGMKSKKQLVNTLEDKTCEWGAMK
jgi:hypothetical protein